MCFVVFLADMRQWGKRVFLDSRMLPPTKANCIVIDTDKSTVEVIHVDLRHGDLTVDEVPTNLTAAILDIEMLRLIVFSLVESCIPADRGYLFFYCCFLLSGEELAPDVLISVPQDAPSIRSIFQELADLYVEGFPTTQLLEHVEDRMSDLFSKMLSFDDLMHSNGLLAASAMSLSHKRRSELLPGFASFTPASVLNPRSLNSASFSRSMPSTEDLFAAAGSPLPSGILSSATSQLISVEDVLQVLG